MNVHAPTRKVLMVTQPILPGRGGSVIIVEKLINHFRPEELVLLGELSPLGRAPKRAADKPQAVYFRSGFSLFGRGARFFAWFRWMLFSWLVKKIVRVAQRENCDYILAVFPDEYYSYAACLAARQLKLPFSLYLHNTYIDNEAVDQIRGAKIQPELFKEAEFILVANDGMKKFYQQKYGFKNVVTWVATFDHMPQLPEMKPAGLNHKDKIKLVLIGNFNASNLEATRRFLETVGHDPQYEIYMYTHVPVPLLKMRGLDTTALIHKGYISDSRLVAELQQYDILVLTHGFTGAYGPIEYQTIFPIRTISLLLSRKPILVHSPRDSFLSDFFRERQAGALVDEPSADAIRLALRKIIEEPEYAQSLAERAFETAQIFHGPNVAAEARQLLNWNVSAAGLPGK